MTEQKTVKDVYWDVAKKFQPAWQVDDLEEGLETCLNLVNKIIDDTYNDPKMIENAAQCGFLEQLKQEHLQQIHEFALWAFFLADYRGPNNPYGRQCSRG